MSYVTDCFSNHTLFHKTLKEAFEVFCNKMVAGCSSAELLSAYCDNILKKGGSEKLSDEAIEETLDKVSPLLPSYCLIYSHCIHKMHCGDMVLLLTDR